MKKGRSLFLFTAIVMLFAFSTVFYADTKVGANVYYSWENGGIMNFTGSGAMYDYKTEGLPSQKSPFCYEKRIRYAVFGEGITSVGANLLYCLNNNYSDVADLEAVQLPNSMLNIGDYAFYDNSGLRSCNFPKNLRTIGSHAFGNTDLKTVNLPASLTKLGKYSFYKNKNLWTLTFAQPTALRTIEEGAFMDCTGLTNVVIPEGVETIEGYAFGRDTNLNKVTIPASVKKIDGFAFPTQTQAPALTILCKYNTAAYKFAKDYNYRYICDDAPAPVGITKLAVTVEAPYFGNALTKTASLRAVTNNGTGAYADIDGVYWYANGTAADGKVAEKGKEYKVQILLSPKCAPEAEYRFTEGMEVTINNMAAYTSYLSNGDLVISYTFPKESEKIGTRYLHTNSLYENRKLYDDPSFYGMGARIFKTPGNYGNAPDGNCTVTEIKWMQGTKDVTGQYTTKGSDYTAVFTVVANGGNRFDASTQFYYDGDNSGSLKPEKAKTTIISPQTAVVTVVYHMYPSVIVTNPTCTESGMEYKECSGCGIRVLIKTTGEALGHDFKIIPGEEATCTKTGITEGTQCSRCKYWAEKQEEIPMKQHEAALNKRGVIAATTEHEGYTGDIICKYCYTVMEKGTSIPKLPSKAEEQPSEKPTPGPSAPTVDPNPSIPSVAAQEAVILAMKSDADPSNSEFAALCAISSKQTVSSITLKWKKVSGAAGYIIYGNKCGKNNRYQKIVTLDGSKTSWTQKNLKKGTSYKYLVVAYGQVSGLEKTLSVSKTIHVYTAKGKIGNYKSIKVNKKKISLSVGKKFTVKASGVKAVGVTKVKEHRKTAYESDNPSVAAVAKNGVISAIGKGTCHVYVYACNGVYQSIQVTVK